MSGYVNKEELLKKVYRDDDGNYVVLADSIEVMSSYDGIPIDWIQKYANAVPWGDYIEGLLYDWEKHHEQ